jgi:hypothetical protein
MTAVAAPQEVAFSDLCAFWPKQWLATDTADTHKYTLFGGSRGPGKSHWLRWYALRRLLLWAAEGHTGVSVMLATEDYPTLTDRQVTKIAREFPHWLGELRTSKERGFGFHLYEAYGGGSILLRNLDKPARYMGAEVAGILVDELTKNALRTFDILRGSLRWPGIADTFFAAATNPGAGWVRDLWISHLYEDERYKHLADIRDQFAFVPALPADNPALDDDYWHMLRTLPRALRQAWLDGDWFVAVEGLVYDDFGVDNIEEYEPDLDRPIELAYDDGYVDPRAILFIQRTGSYVYVFDELYESRRLGEQSVKAVIERCERNQWPIPEIAVGSPEAVELRQHWRRADIPARSTKTPIIEGVKAVRRLICDGQGYRALKIHPRCVNLINELTSGYQYPPEGARRDEEKPLDGNDHACDALRYWVWMRARYIDRPEDTDD